MTEIAETICGEIPEWAEHFNWLYYNCGYGEAYGYFDFMVMEGDGLGNGDAYGGGYADGNGLSHTYHDENGDGEGYGDDAVKTDPLMSLAWDIVL